MPSSLCHQAQEEVLSIYLRTLLIDLAKAALADFAAVMVTLQFPVPEHAPDQPVKTDPLVAAAVRVIDVP